MGGVIGRDWARNRQWGELPDCRKRRNAMVRALTAEADIAAAQAALRAEFYSEATVLDHVVGFPGGNTTVEIAWHPAVGVWGHVETIESAHGPRGFHGRYWNAFGLEDPATTGTLAVAVEVNPPLRGTRARVGGILGRDGDGPVVLLHRGTIGGGTVGVGKDLFWREFAGRTKFVWDGAGLVDCAVVATLGQGTLVTELRRFADAVAQIKARARRRSRSIDREAPEGPAAPTGAG